MNPNLKLALLFADRIGIVKDVAAIIADYGLNIISMEVQQKAQRSYVYLELEDKDVESDRKGFFTELKALPRWIETKVIHTLPQEKREEGYKVVLDSVSDGIISVDEEGIVTTINRVAGEILGLTNTQDAIGKHIQDLVADDHSLLQCLKSKTTRRVRRDIITDKGRFQFISSYKPVKDTAGRIVGAVEIMKDMKEIEELAHAVSHQSDITFSNIIGEAPVIQEAISMARRIAKTDAIVSLRGESGTGKELFARAIAFESNRKGPFVPINCAALPESLLESELFGYVGGAFTGARRQGKPGLFEIARKGTVFLDEIADTPVNVQAKILRLIQERCVRRIGGTEEIPVQARIVTATNRNLEKMVAANQFREDFYYRINVLPIHIPPLRRRIEDIPLLLNHFLFRLNSRLNKNVQMVSDKALDKLTRHNWPGNVRELKNVIERAAILAEKDLVDVNCILFSFEVAKNIRGTMPRSHGRVGIQSLKAMLDAYEKQLVREAMGRSLSVRKTAGLLNISHTTLLNKLKKHGITVESN
jgi:transcriptional regulator of aroF, aroG, tyrA and aromatic amino acid transport